MLVLASTSAARRAMLAAAGVPFEAAAPGVDEQELKRALGAEGASARAIADALAEAKAVRLSRRLGAGLVLGADQMLACEDGTTLDKAPDMASLRRQLLDLRGRVAMRVPALLDRYALAICSGDFNEWIWKNATTDWPNSYMFVPEYEMFDFNLGMTFNYGEMAALIAPRAFMVERGHDDGVGIDEWIAFEYAKVNRLYDKLRIPHKTEIEYFNGGHEIHAVGTFRFIHRIFDWPLPE